jgi:hypothetical protein
MRYSRKILTISAFLAVAVWANAQVMACCWFSEKAASIISRLETVAVSSAEAHSCCPGEKADAAAAPKTDGYPSFGCELTIAPVEITVTSPVAFPQILLATLSFSEIAHEDFYGLHSRTMLSAASDPPRYLSFQRILI